MNAPIPACPLTSSIAVPPQVAVGIERNRTAANRADPVEFDRSVCPWVLIGVAHPAMRRLILALLDREPGHWNACIHPAEPAIALRDLKPDIAIVDGVDFPRCCDNQPIGFPLGRVVVIGAEPDADYQAAALGLGAGGWVARDDIADELTTEMRRVLGRRQDLVLPRPDLRRAGSVVERSPIR